MTITLTREEAQQVLDALKHLCLHSRAIAGYDGEKVQPPIDMLKAKLQPIEPTIDGWPLWSGLPPQEEQGLTATPLPAIKLQNQSEWHELTDGEIATIKTKYEFGVNSHSFINAVRELETWLKERNNG